MSHIAIEVDQAVGSAYISLSLEPVVRTTEHSDGILIDLDRFDVAVGIELLDQHTPIPFGALIDRYHVRSDVVELLRRVRPDVASFVMLTSAVEGSCPEAVATHGSASVAR